MPPAEYEAPIAPTKPAPVPQEVFPDQLREQRNRGRTSDSILREKIRAGELDGEDLQDEDKLQDLREAAAAEAGANTPASGGAESLEDLTVDQLQSRAAEAEVEGRSSMNKQELIDALSER